MTPENNQNNITSLGNQDKESVASDIKKINTNQFLSTEEILPPIDITSLDDPTTIAERPPIDLLAVEEEFSKKMNNFVPPTIHSSSEIEKLYEANRTEEENKSIKDREIEETIKILDEKFKAQNDK